MSAQASPRLPVHEPAGLRLLRVGLGLLWIADGLLQAQPGMFTMDMVSTIMQPAATGEPGWLSHLITWSISWVTPHLVAFNWGVVILQLAIGGLLLSRPRGLRRAGAVLGGMWGLLVWLFGEGLGQLLTGSATALSGAPGSALVYVLGSAVLLSPTAALRVRLFGRSLASVAAGVILLLGAALQLNPLFFTSLGLSGVFGQAAMMGQPGWMRAPIVWVTNLSAGQPVAVNLALTLGFAVAGAAVLLPLSPRWARAATVGVVLWIAAIWWLGQDFGMPFSGMETDPNTALPLALLVLSGYQAERATVAGSRQGTAPSLPAQAAQTARTA